MDGGFASLEAIDKASGARCVVYAPLKDEEKQLAAGKDRTRRKKGDSEAVAAWRERMGTAAAKLIYRLRCQTAEWVNALCRNRGVWQMPVRGQPKCRTVAVLYAIVHNIAGGVKLRRRRRCWVDEPKLGETRETRQVIGEYSRRHLGDKTFALPQELR